MTNARPSRRRRRLDYDVRLVDFEALTLAAVRETEVPLQDLDVAVEQGHRTVREHLREHGIKPGRRVVVYVSSNSNGFVMLLDCIIGLEVAGEVPAAEDNSVRVVQIPAGRAAMTTHWGDYTQVPDAHAAVHDWCRANKHEVAGINWEVYGEWAEDPVQRRTDVYYALAPGTGA